MKKRILTYFTLFSLLAAFVSTPLAASADIIEDITQTETEEQTNSETIPELELPKECDDTQSDTGKTEEEGLDDQSTIEENSAQLPEIAVMSNESILAASNFTVTSQAGEVFSVRDGFVEEDVKNQLVARYGLYLSTDNINLGITDVRDLINVVYHEDTKTVDIDLMDNNNFSYFTYNIDGNIYFTGHNFMCEYVSTDQIPLDKYNSGDIVSIEDYDGFLRTDNGESFNTAAIQFYPEAVVIADFHGNFMKTPYYMSSGYVHLFSGFRSKQEIVIPQPPITLHFIINGELVYFETTIEDWETEIQPILSNDAAIWQYIKEKTGITSDDPYIDYGSWSKDYAYDPETLLVHDVWFSVTTKEKEANLLITHDYDGNKVTAWQMQTTEREAKQEFEANIPNHANVIDGVEEPKTIGDDYHTVNGWELSSTETVLTDGQYEFIYHFKPKMIAHKIEKEASHIYHNYDDYSVFSVKAYRDDPMENVKTPAGMVFDHWEIEGEKDQLVELTVDRDNLLSHEVRETHYVPVFKAISKKTKSLPKTNEIDSKACLFFGLSMILIVGVLIKSKHTHNSNND